MKKLIILLTLFLIAGSAGAQMARVHLNFDSVKHQLSLQKTTRDSLPVMQQLADASYPLDDYSLLGSKPDYVTQLLVLNKRVKVIDPHPYELVQQAATYVHDNKLVQALDATKQAIREFDKQHKAINPLLVYIRLLFNKLNDQEGKLLYYQQRLEYYQVNGPVENTAACYHGIAGYYNYKAAFNQAINNYLKAAEVYRRFNQRFYGNEMMVVGSDYNRWGNNDKTISYLDKVALPVALKLNDSLHLSYIYSIKGDVSEAGHLYQKAIGEMDKAISYEGQGSRSAAFATFAVHKGFDYLELGQSSTALSLFKKAKHMADSAGYHVDNTTGELEIDYGFYKYYRQEGNLAEAERSLLEANRKASEEKTARLELKYLKELGDFYTGQGKPQLGTKYYNRYFALNAQAEKDLDHFKVAQYEIDMNDQQQRDHITQLKQEKAVQDYQISRRNTLLWGSLVILALISALLVFIYRQLQTNKKTLLSLRQTQTQLIQSEKMASLGELTAGIAHEIQNPLNFVNNFSEVSIELLSELKDEEENGHKEDVMAIAGDLTQNLEKISHHGRRADAIVKGMLQHSQTGSGTKEPTNINALADECMRLSYHGLRAKDKSFNAELVTQLDGTLPKANVIPQDMVRVMLNLFNNAFYAVNQKQKNAGADYKPEVSVSTSTANGKVIIKVKDNGVGIPDAIKEKIMQPFFTTKPTGEGTGLGLSLTYDMVVKGHGGKIDINTKEGEFTEFIVTLPL